MLYAAAAVGNMGDKAQDDAEKNIEIFKLKRVSLGLVLWPEAGLQHAI